MLNTGVWRSTSEELTTAVRVSIMPQKVPGKGQSSQASEIKDARGGQHPYDGNKRVGRFDLLRPSGGPRRASPQATAEDGKRAQQVAR